MGLSRFSTKVMDALDAGWQIVTPNNRLARQLSRAYGQRQLEQQRKAWSAPTVLPWTTWLDTLWQMLSDRTNLPQRIHPLVARMLWEEVIESDQHISLLAPARAASLAQEAWRLLHEWRAANEPSPWRQWGKYETHDVRCFSRWASQYQQHLTEKNVVDGALMPDVLEAHASQLVDVTMPPVLLTGFIEFTPVARRMAEALRSAGLCVEQCDTLDAPEADILGCFDAEQPHDEWRQALSWAWQRREEGQTAIIIPDLAQHIHDVRRCVEEIIPQKSSCNISLGESLADRALVREALDLLRLYDDELPTSRVTALLQSPYWPGDISLRAARAGLEKHWLKEGRRTLRFADVAFALRGVDAALHQRWQKVAQRTQGEEVLPKKASAAMWSHHLCEFWQILGWLGGRPLDSATHQVFKAWQQCVESLVFLDSLNDTFERGNLIRMLAQQAETSVFQPQDHDAPIHIMGALEASGLPFDALWVCGLSAQSWPPPMTPHPLLPLSWQRKQGMRRADLERNRLFCEEMYAQWRRAAPQIVMSYARQQDGEACLPATVLHDLPTHMVDYPLLKTRAVLTPKTAFTKIVDEQAPNIILESQSEIAEHIRHGSSVMTNQSDCPFKAFACSRLRIDEWPQADDGISASEHGTLVHATLQHLWSALKTQEQLLALNNEALTAEIERAYQKACPSKEGWWQRLPEPVVAVAHSRTTALVKKWCEQEKARAPFIAKQFEERFNLTLSGLTLALRIDRVDQLLDDDTEQCVALLDYKTGTAGSTRSWFDERPSNIQLCLYALAWQQTYPTRPVTALAYAHIRSGGMKWVGVQQNNSFPALNDVESLGVENMTEAQEKWQKTFSALAKAFVDGDARVAPRDAGVCTYCCVQPFCRIKAVRDFNEEGGDDE